MKHTHHKEIKAWADGEVIEHCKPGSTIWREVKHPSWSPTSIYRVAPVKPSITWDHVHESYVALTMDSHGRAFLWTVVPEVRKSYWTSKGECTTADTFRSLFKSPRESWADSLVLRHER